MHAGQGKQGNTASAVVDSWPLPAAAGDGLTGPDAPQALMRCEKSAPDPTPTVRTFAASLTLART